MDLGLFFKWSWDYKENCLTKDIKKENCYKDLLNLIETKHQVNMTSDPSISSNNSFKSQLNTKSFDMILTL